MNSTAAPFPSSRPGHWGVLAFVLTYLFYAFVWVRQGFSPEDAGFLIGLSWRVFDGQIPYRDFIHVRPPVPFYLHALPLFCGRYALFADRLLSLAQLALASIAGTWVLLSATRPKGSHGDFWIVALAAFVLTAHNWPAFGWPTVDGVLFSALSLLALTRHRFVLAGALALTAMLCKQNFLAFAAFGLAFSMLAGPRATLRYVAGCVALAVPVFGYFFHQGALNAMQQQVLSAGQAGDIWDAGVAEYARVIATPGIGVALVASLLVGLGVWRRQRSIPTAATLGYTAFVLLALILFASQVREAAAEGANYHYMMVEFSESSALLVVAAGLMLPWPAWTARAVGHESQPMLQQNAASLAGLFVIAWTSSISRGYQVAAFFSVPLLAPLVAWGSSLRVRPLLRALTGVALVVFGMAYAYPYGESLRMDELSAIPERFHGTALIRTSPSTIAKLNELAAWSDRDPIRPLVVMPAFTPASFLLQRHPAARLDWVIDGEVPAASRDLVVRELCQRHARVIVERSLAERVLADEGAPWHSAVLERVVTEWPRQQQGAYFDVYEPPGICDPGGR